jgi:hypothetical protein
MRKRKKLRCRSKVSRRGKKRNNSHTMQKERKNQRKRGKEKSFAILLLFRLLDLFESVAEHLLQGNSLLLLLLQDHEMRGNEFVDDLPKKFPLQKRQYLDV